MSFMKIPDIQKLSECKRGKEMVSIREPEFLQMARGTHLT